MTADLESQKKEVTSVEGLFAPSEGNHQQQDEENSANIPVKDVAKEELDIRSPNESDSETEKSLGWKSKDDAGNPKNWSFGKKVFHTAIPALYGFVM